VRSCLGAAQSLLRKGAAQGYTADASLAPEKLQLVSSLCFRASGQPLGAQATKSECEELLDKLTRQADALATGLPETAVESLHCMCKRARAKDYLVYSQDVSRLATSLSPPLDMWLQKLVQSGFQVAPAATGSMGEMEAEERMAAKQVKQLLPDAAEVVLLQQTGSFMYDLQVESSDRDFALIFMSDPQALLSTDPPPDEFHHHVDSGFGSDKRGEVEYSGRELGRFVVELAKGNPKNVELLFSGKAALRGWAMEELRAIRCRFLTLRCAKQYLGFISERLHRVAEVMEAASEGSPAAKASEISKLLYHAHHKMADLQRVLRNEWPHVALSGEERDRVLALRRRPPQSWQEVREQLQSAEEQRFALAQELKVVAEQKRLPAEVDAALLLQWLRSVRARSCQAG